MVYNSSAALGARHIQDGKGLYTLKYWGYAERQMPCTKDKGSCEYLDAVYGAHVLSMVYTFIMWAVLGVLLIIAMFSRLLRPRQEAGRGAKQGGMYRLSRGMAAFRRRYLGSECTKVFKYTTKLQVVILGVLCAYLIVFSFIGITYKTWITPIKDSNLHNIRSGVGGFADRVGAFAFALTPLTITLCTRDSILSLVTGIPYQSFNFLHRWTGRIILVQSFVHAIIWTIVEGRLYQPQPTTYIAWIKQEYMIWGIVAQSFITFLFVFSLRPVIRLTGYEFFRKSHLLVSGLYLGACYGHWRQLRCWILASLAIMGLDLVARTVRTLLLHCGYKDARQGFGFRSVPSVMETFKDPTGTIVRMSFEVRHAGWNIGQHFYLTFPALNVWQAHPFTPLSSPNREAGVQRHTYIIRACAGETGRLAKLAEDAGKRYPVCQATTPVVLQGAYGGSIVDREVENVLAVTGGTGVTFAIPVVMAALEEKSAVRNIELVWTVRHVENLAWVEPELAFLKEQLGRVAEKRGKRFRIRIFVTRPDTVRHENVVQHFDEKKKEYGGDDSPASMVSESELDFEELVRECPGFSITNLNNGRPDISNLVAAFMEQTVEGGRTQVVGSGPPDLGTQLRAAVASHNAPGEVWRGNARGDVACVWDDRMG